MPATAVASPLRTRARRSLAALMLAAGLVGVAACSSPAPSKSELSEALVDSGLSPKVADCAASALTKSLTSSELAEITERGAGGAPVDDPKVTNDSADKLAKAMAACRELQIASQPTTTTTTVPVGGGSSTAPTAAPGTDGAEFNTTSTTAAP